MPESDQLRCPQCGYSLLGLTAPQCPECRARVRIVGARINTTQTLALVACRLAAIWLMLGVATSFLNLLLRVGTMVYLSQSDVLSVLLLMGVVLLINGALAWFFWAKAPWLAGKITHGCAESVPSWSLDYQALLGVGLAIVGVVTLTSALPWLASWIHVWLYEAAPHGPGATASVKPPQVDVVVTIAQTALGLWLTFGSRGLSWLLFKIRSFGVQPPAGNASPEKSTPENHP